MNSVLLVACVVALSLVCVIPALAQGGGESNEATIEQVLNEVQKALNASQEKIVGLGMPPLSSVELTLETVLVKSGGPKFKLFIFSFGKTWEKERSQKLVLTLKPAPLSEIKELRATPTLSEQLVDAIVSAANGVQEARKNKPSLELTGLNTVVSFVVKTDTSAGIAFEIVPVSLELSGDLSKKAIHTISLTFERPEES